MCRRASGGDCSCRGSPQKPCRSQGTVTEADPGLQELAERKAELLKKTEPKREEAAHASRDTRSVEELLSFIEKEGQEGQSKKKAKKKPKKKRDTSMDQGSREREAGSDYAHQMERTLSGYGKLPNLE